MFTETGEVIQDQSYYPFGMCIGAEMSFNNTDDSPENHYLYNGKEQQMDFELDWYDYGARFYDAELGRWHVVDPLAESFNSWTPYHFVHNNPLCLITCQRFLLPTLTLPLLI
jgi:RHS repeat-associated protein